MNSELITHRDPKSPISEVFKTLRTNLQFMKHKDDAISLLVTSTMPGEGKTWITSNLGIAFAQSNKKVVIIDSDMRKGRLHNVFDTKIFPGLSNYLAENKKSIKDYIIQTEIENLCIIPAGNVPPNPSELLSTERMLQGVEELKKSFDVILFDSTPCMLVTDAVIISRIVDATMIVSSHKLTKMENLKTVQKNIENVGGKIAGVIINRIPVSLKKYKDKYYYYGERSKTAKKDENNGEKSKSNVDDSSSHVYQEEVNYVEVENQEQAEGKVAIEKQDNQKTEKENKKAEEKQEGKETKRNGSKQKASKKAQEEDEIMNQIDEFLDNKNKEEG